MAEASTLGHPPMLCHHAVCVSQHRSSTGEPATQKPWAFWGPKATSEMDLCEPPTSQVSLSSGQSAHAYWQPPEANAIPQRVTFKLQRLLWWRYYPYFTKKLSPRKSKQLNNLINAKFVFSTIAVLLPDPFCPPEPACPLQDLQATYILLQFCFPT